MGVPTDPTSPLVLFAGDASMFGTIKNFTDAVLSAHLTLTNMSDGSKIITFAAPGKLPEIVFPWSQNKTSLKMPTIGGVPMSASPREVYDGPFLQATLGERTVTA